jgi:hypothetical protein
MKIFIIFLSKEDFLTFIQKEIITIERIKDFLTFKFNK